VNIAVLQPTGAGTQSVLFTTDVVLKAASLGTGDLLSSDPNAVSANYSSPVSAGFDRTIIAIQKATGGGLLVFPDPVPVPAGERVYVAFTTKGTIVIYFDLA
jgi:hypothetical protein